ncbi:MAG: hypothetical protein GXY43_07090 [Clostridiaceae bacterium]|nr:hypothetical protein [Clostridiaceae bacterium]
MRTYESAYLRIEVTDQEIRFCKSRQNVLTIPFENHIFSSYVSSYRIQFIFVITNRYLRVQYPDGKIKSHLCSGFSDELFKAFVEDVQQVHQKDILKKRQSAPSVLDKSDVGLELPFGGVQFQFPKEEFRKRLFLKMWGKFFVYALISAILSTAIVAPTVIQVLHSDLTSVIRYVSVAFFILFVPTGFILWSNYRSNTRKIPEVIRISDSAIRIDETIFHIEHIRQIDMTPDTLIPVPGELLNLVRKIRIQTTEGNREYLLGHVKVKRTNYIYDQYSALFDSVNAFISHADRSGKS